MSLGNTSIDLPYLMLLFYLRCFTLAFLFFCDGSQLCLFSCVRVTPQAIQIFPHPAAEKPIIEFQKNITQVVPDLSKRCFRIFRHVCLSRNSALKDSIDNINLFAFPCIKIIEKHSEWGPLWRSDVPSYRVWSTAETIKEWRVHRRGNKASWKKVSNNNRQVSIICYGFYI